MNRFGSMYRWGLFAFGLILTVGSFSLSFVGGWTPCIYCLTLRYLGAAFSVIALVNALRPGRPWAAVMFLLAVGSVGVAGYLINKDFRRLGYIKPDPIQALTGSDESCAPGQTCSTPVIVGLPASAYALAGFSALAIGSLLLARRKAEP